MRSVLPLSLALLLLPGEVAACQESPAPALRTVHSWADQLAEVEPRAIAASGFDLVVIDYSQSGDQETAFTPAQVATMKRKRDGTARIVLAYLSIGEAEDYRYYWQPSWVRQPPAWLGRENPESKGNYQVRFWEPGWQGIIFGRPDSYLDRILRAGFDGVYLDLIDAYEPFVATRPQAEREMVEFVRDLSRYAKSKRGGAFYVFAQNGEPLTAHPQFMAAIDGIGKEDLFYGFNGTATFSPRAETEYSLDFLRRARRAGKVVLTVDYTSDAATAAQIYRRSRAQGFVAYCTTRELDRLTVNRGLDPPAPGRASPRASRMLPGQFFALTAPPGVVRSSLSVDSWRESLRDDEPANAASDALQEWTYGLMVGYGIARNWELGVRIPVVSGHFEGAGTDPARSTGLGNVTLFVGRGWSSDQGNRNVLATIEASLPTDTRVPEFHSGVETHLSLTGERYWGRAGVIGSLGATYRADAPSDAVADFSAGFGLQASDRLFGSVRLGAEGSTVRAETDAELLVSGDKSIEMFFGRDVSGTADASFFGVGFNFWLIPARRHRAIP
ncbi:MAG: MJ1477/TM1410 family putative glycoside hydrolase [Longimicrobiaceae bacterium]